MIYLGIAAWIILALVFPVTTLAVLGFIVLLAGIKTFRHRPAILPAREIHPTVTFRDRRP